MIAGATPCAQVTSATLGSGIIYQKKGVLRRVKYRHLSMNEREDISLGLAQGRSRRDIAAMLDRSPATISREIRRNNYTYGGYQYRSMVAHSKACRRARIPRKSRKLDTNERLRQFVFEHLDKRWTPEQIAKRLKKLYPMDITMQISHEKIEEREIASA